MKFLAYDMLRPDPDASAKRKIRRTLSVLPILFGILGLFAIFYLEADNMGGPASSALPGIARSSNNFLSWFQNGFWYSAVTPTPLYITALAVVFRVFGYAPSYAMAATCLLSVLGYWAIGTVTTRRFGLLGGLLAQLLFITNPPMVQLSISSGYYMWGLVPVFIAIDLLDRYHITNKRWYYFAAAVALLCSGMSRPENFVLAFAPIVLVSAPLLSRAVFCGIAWSYPLLSALYTFANGLAVPNSAVAQKSDTLVKVFTKWVGLSADLLVHNLVGMHWVLLGIGMLVLCAFTRMRFFSMICALLWAFFCLLFLALRAETYFTHHYALVSALLLVFASGAVTEIIWLVTRNARRYIPTKGMPVVYALIGIIVIVALTPLGRAKSLATNLTSQVRQEARDARTFLRRNASSSEAIIIDHSSEVTWFFSELYNAERHLWAYYSVDGPRPFAGIRKDDASIRAMNEFIANGFKPWLIRVRPEWFITQSESEWAKIVPRLIHPQLFGIRPALQRKSFHDGSKIFLDEFTVQLKQRYENSTFTVYELEYFPAGYFGR